MGQCLREPKRRHVQVTPARFRFLVLEAARALPFEVFHDAPMLVESTLRHSAMPDGDSSPRDFLSTMGHCAVLWGGSVQYSADAIVTALLRHPEFRDPVSAAVTGCVDRARRRLAS